MCTVSPVVSYAAVRGWLGFGKRETLV